MSAFSFVSLCLSQNSADLENGSGQHFTNQKMASPIPKYFFFELFLYFFFIFLLFWVAKWRKQQQNSWKRKMPVLLKAPNQNINEISEILPWRYSLHIPWGFQYKRNTERLSGNLCMAHCITGPLHTWHFTWMVVSILVLSLSLPFTWRSVLLPGFFFVQIMF